MTAIDATRSAHQREAPEEPRKVSAVWPAGDMESYFRLPQSAETLVAQGRGKGRSHSRKLTCGLLRQEVPEPNGQLSTTISSAELGLDLQRQPMMRPPARVRASPRGLPLPCKINASPVPLSSPLTAMGRELAAWPFLVRIILTLGRLAAGRDAGDKLLEMGSQMACFACFSRFTGTDSFRIIRRSGELLSCVGS
jgi:hypothetical protein